MWLQSIYVRSHVGLQIFIESVFVGFSKNNVYYSVCLQFHRVFLKETKNNNIFDYLSILYTYSTNIGLYLVLPPPPHTHTFVQRSIFGLQKNKKIIYY